MSNKTEIEGANELELLEFVVGDELFGINIAKVSEIIIHCEVTRVPSSPPAVEGVFMHRNKLVTVLSLHSVLSVERNPEVEGLLIVCDFEQLSIAFHVDKVNGIQRLSWSNVEKPPTVTDVNGGNISTGIAKISDKIIMILDFEKIVCDLNHGKEFDLEEANEFVTRSEVDYTRGIVIAEDSIFLNKIMCDALRKAGFQTIHTFYTGRDAWQFIEAQKSSADISHNVAGVISDIEMPLMDGHTLTRYIKTDKRLVNIPVILFSSLIHENMRQRGDVAGADDQFSRSQLSECINRLVELLAIRAR